MDRTIIQPMEQMRDFDFVSFEHDVLVALGGLANDVASGLPSTVAGGLVATQTSTPSLTINIASGRIYQLAVSDAVADGSIPADLNVITQQGFASTQTVTLVAPSSGQSQWNLIQAQFSQVDAVRTGDPNGGIVPFYNVTDPTQPTLNSINTVRKGVCVLQVISGSAATTGSEVPPNPTNGWIPLYLIDLTGGQTQITTSQIKVAGPSVGTGVSAAYPSAPFLAGLLKSHHGGTAGQAPKIILTSEVQGVLPYANMSAVRTLLNAPLTLYVNFGTGSDANAGLAPTAAYKTIQAAINSVYRNYDFNGFGCTVSVANGSYLVTSGPSTYAVNFNGQPVGLNSPIVFTGNIASPGSVTIGATNGNGVNVGSGATVTMAGFTITTTGTNIGVVSSAGYGINVQGGTLNLSSCVIGSCGSVQLTATLGGLCVVSGGLALTGTTQYGLVANLCGTVWTNGIVLTQTGLTVSVASIYAAECGNIAATGMTFIGTPTGRNWLATLNGTIATGGQPTTYFPGTIQSTFPAGTGASLGGQYQ